MTSTRLPGKVLKTIHGQTLLQYHLRRLQQSGLPIVVATTTNLTDDPIVQACLQEEVPVHRGSEHDVLSRYFEAAEKFAFDVVVRVTSDCPLIDGQLIHSAVEKHLTDKTPWLYTSNVLERTYPRGFDFEIFSFDMLKTAFHEARSTSEREHVTPYLHQNKHGQTRFQHIKRFPDMSSHRLTVDEPDDFRLMEELIQKYHCDEMNEDQIAHVLLEHPELKEINQHIEQKKT
jgi:spore coat polysaccharide biosynthesis protein SpsF